MADGGWVTSTDTLSGTAISAHKEFFTAGGQLAVAMDETLNEMPCPEWEQALAAWQASFSAPSGVGQ
jgi:hypothetical protein